MVAVVEADTERLAGRGDRRTERRARDRSSGGGRLAPIVDRMQLGMPCDRGERVGERVVTRKRGEVVPAAFVLERGTTVDVDEAQNTAHATVAIARALSCG